MLGCQNPSCMRRFCRHCLLTHLGEEEHEMVPPPPTRLHASMVAEALNSRSEPRSGLAPRLPLAAVSSFSCASRVLAAWGAFVLFGAPPCACVEQCSATAHCEASTLGLAWCLAQANLMPALKHWLTRVAYARTSTWQLEGNDAQPWYCPICRSKCCCAKSECTVSECTELMRGKPSRPLFPPYLRFP